MNLYEIDNEILGCVDAETGEIFDEEKFRELGLSRDAKIENICLWIKNLSAEIEALKAEKMAFDNRQKVAENKMESLKKYIAGYLDGAPYESTKVKVSFRKSESLEVLDFNLIPDEFLKYNEPTVDKAGIKAAMKLGKNFDGIAIIEKQNIQIK